jgi:hypothetical protein
MAKVCIRIAGALGVTALALFFVGLVPFFADPTVGGSAAKAPAFSVNRELKGNRLPGAGVATTASRGGLRNELGAREQPPKRTRIPIGCEGSFSPISSPRLAHVLGRCMT